MQSRCSFSSRKTCSVQILRKSIEINYVILILDIMMILSISNLESKVVQTYKLEIVNLDVFQAKVIKISLIYLYMS